MSKPFDLINFFWQYLPKNHWFSWICHNREYSNKYMLPVKLCKYVVYVSTYVRTLTCSIHNKNMNISQMEAAQWKFDKNLLKVKRQFSKSSIKKSKFDFLSMSFYSLDLHFDSIFTFTKTQASELLFLSMSTKFDFDLDSATKEVGISW